VEAITCCFLVTYGNDNAWGFRNSGELVAAFGHGGAFQPLTARLMWRRVSDPPGRVKDPSPHTGTSSPALKDHLERRLQRLRKNSRTLAARWESGPSGPRNCPGMNRAFQCVRDNSVAA
jgi:hypothetical protein